MQILTDVPFRSGNIEHLESEMSDLHFKGRAITYSIPVIIGDIDDELNVLIHIFLINKASKKVKDLMPTAKALLLWLRWMKEHNVDPFRSPLMESYHPTKGFRQYLINRMNLMPNYEPLASSTASSYINTIRAFYEMLVSLQRVEQNEFFTYEISRAGRKRVVQSTDLAIRKRNSQTKSLNPMPRKVQEALIRCIPKRAIEYQLCTRFMKNSGLRIGEATTLSEELFDESRLAITEGSLVRGIYINSETGVKTKNDKKRELFITTTLYEDILDYLISDRYEKRLRKWKAKYGDFNKHQPIFITKSGEPFTSETYYSDWYHLKRLVKDELGTKIKHKPHDLRATFATNFLGTAMEKFPDHIESALASLRDWMGHESEETTLKYIEFLKKNDISNQIAEVMDTLISESIEGIE